MNILMPYIILIERRRLRRAFTLVLTCLALLFSSLGLQTAHAKPFGQDKRAKVARDLDDEIGQSRSPRARWARDLNGVRHIQAIVVSDSTDPAMTDLRNHVTRTGGTVQAVHSAMRALTVQIKANQVRALAERDDVVSVSPNRATQRTASTLETITGSLTANVRATSTKTTYTGLDGTGIGIAVLDSGVMREHWAFADANAGYRVKRNVNMLNTTLADWTSGSAGATSLTPGSTALATYEAALANESNLTQDAYGHGTHEIGRAHV